METPVARPESPLSARAVYKRAPECISANMAGEVAILDSRSGIYYGMNEVGAAIWQFIVTERTLPEIVAMVLDTYNVAPAQCESDVLRILEQLKAAALVHIDAKAD